MHLHSWTTIAYDNDKEVAWICVNCGLDAQLKIGKNMEIRNDPDKSIIPSIQSSQISSSFSSE